MNRGHARVRAFHEMPDGSFVGRDEATKEPCRSQIIERAKAELQEYLVDWSSSYGEFDECKVLVQNIRRIVNTD